MKREGWRTGENRTSNIEYSTSNVQRGKTNGRSQGRGMNLNTEVLKKVVVEGLAEEGVVLSMPLPEPSELRLVGSRALLKSIQLVSLLVGIEQRLHERFGLDISLMDEQAMSQTRSPFRNVESLVQYLQKVTGDRNLEIGSR